MDKKGLFISFEGGDGAGKTTQLHRLADMLRSRGLEVITSREPGGSEGAEAIRKLLVEGDAARWSAMTELLLFNASRRDHLERTINPALERGAIVLCDRFADSSRVYQGVARKGEADRTITDALHKLVIGVEPDLTLVFDISPETSLSRGLARGTAEERFESLGLQFQRDLQAGYRALVEEFPQRCHLVDAEGSPDDVAPRVEAIVMPILSQHFGLSQQFGGSF